MMKILLAAIIAVFVAAFAFEVTRKERRTWRERLAGFGHDFKRGFLEGYRSPEPRTAPAPAA